MKILAFIPTGQNTSPCRYYRGDGVLERIPGVEIEYLKKNMTWVEWLRAAKRFSCLYVMRSCCQEECAIVEAAQDAGLPVWYDLDDDYFNVLPDSPAFEHFSKESTKQAVYWLLMSADLVTFSTQQLKNELGVYCRRSVVVPNALDDSLMRFPIAPRSNAITWRGGSSHMKDLVDFMPGIMEGLEGNNLEAHFLGVEVNKMNVCGMFPSINAYKDRIKVHPYVMGYWNYMRYIREIRPLLQVVPLADNKFNRAKSNISALEAISIGALPIVPSWEEWDIPGCPKFTNEAEFASILKETVRQDMGNLYTQLGIATDWVNENRLLSKVNMQRKKLLDELHESSHWVNR